MNPQKVFPAGLLLENRRQLVIGSNEETHRKAGIAVEAGCRVTVIGRDPIPELSDLARRKKIRLVRRHWRAADIGPKYAIVISCLPGDSDNRKIVRECARHRIWVNILDRPRLCTFFAPAIHRTGHLTFSVFADGLAPILLRRIREDLQARYRHLGPLAEAVGRMRQKIKRLVGEESERRRILYLAVTSDWVSKISMEKNVKRLRAAAEKRLLSILRRHGPNYLK
ncbi:bifunctional precorrin-2 dehydrogenase/sirohydrochlorin ferrochelatase [bacterium]|nr:bifunctional precorrin-2 dehydrogenase/sirohydrochlorin ferrochelatase [bacterium]